MNLAAETVAASSSSGLVAFIFAMQWLTSRLIKVQSPSRPAQAMWVSRRRCCFAVVFRRTPCGDPGFWCPPGDACRQYVCCHICLQLYVTKFGCDDFSYFFLLSCLTAVFSLGQSNAKRSSCGLYARLSLTIDA